jgi:ATP-dependent Lhr-like helicase
MPAEGGQKNMDTRDAPAADVSGVSDVSDVIFARAGDLTAEAVFDAYSPFIREFIYSRGWNELHEVQLIAADVIFSKQGNLLIPSSTASGKTEAAFFPILSQFYDELPLSFGCIYIAPLKSLINDQFGRISELLDETGIPVTHWHGDVAASHKQKALKAPSGVLQITPESLEAMLINRSNDLVRLFGDLRYVIIDEIHTLTGSDRGNQILCQLSRLGRIIGHHPRRIGLSATVGDVESAARWLAAGTDAETYVPKIDPPKIRWRLGMEHFYIQNDNLDQSNEGGEGIRQKIGENEGGVASPDTDAQGGQAFAEPQPADGAAADAAEDDTSGAAPDDSADDRSISDMIPDPVKCALDPGYEYIYDCVKNKKSLVFSNSREETEYICATLRQIAENRGDPDVFLIHHGFLSASIREEAEMKMKDDETFAVTCATVTMELGIDIGRLERVLQQGSPNSVSSFLQRLGRSGRRGEPPEMMMVFREEEPLTNAPLPQLIPWDLLKAIAIVQLYIEERYIEPPQRRKLPFSLAFQQTLSVLASSGALTAAQLAEAVLSLPPFRGIPKEDYRELLLSMLQNEYLQMTDEREIIIGLRGERLINSYKFYAVFKDTDDYTVRCESDEIGEITTPPPVGDRFALAGRVWEVTDLDLPRRLVYCKRVKGKMEVSWPGDFGEVDTRILERMRDVLREDTIYPYLKPNARRRLEVARAVARATGMTERSMLCLGGYTWVLFPWLGTRSFRTLRRYMAKNAAPFKLSSIEFEGCYFITFKMERGDGAEYLSYLENKLKTEGLEPAALIGPNETPVFEKYDECIPSELLRHAYAADKLRTDEILRRIPELAEIQRAGERGDGGDGRNGGNDVTFSKRTEAIT